MVINRRGEIVTAYDKKITKPAYGRNKLDIPINIKLRFHHLFSQVVLPELKKKINISLKGLTHKEIKKSLVVKNFFENLDKFRQFAGLFNIFILGHIP